MPEHNKHHKEANGLHAIRHHGGRCHSACKTWLRRSTTMQLTAIAVYVFNLNTASTCKGIKQECAVSNVILHDHVTEAELAERRVMSSTQRLFSYAYYMTCNPQAWRWLALPACAWLRLMEFKLQHYLNTVCTNNCDSGELQASSTNSDTATSPRTRARTVLSALQEVSGCCYHALTSNVGPRQVARQEIGCAGSPTN